MFFFLHDKRGMSLVALAIIAAIAGLAVVCVARFVVPKVMDYAGRGAIGQIKSDLHTLDNAAQMYVAKHGVYPPAGCIAGTDAENTPSTKESFAALVTLSKEPKASYVFKSDKGTECTFLGYYFGIVSNQDERFANRVYVRLKIGGEEKVVDKLPEEMNGW